MDPRQIPPSQHHPHGYGQGYSPQGYPQPPKKKKAPLLLGLLALLVVAGGISLLFLPNGGIQSAFKDGLAVVADTDGALWGEGDIEPVPGETIDAGTLGLEAGRVNLAFHNGLKVGFVGPGQVEIVDSGSFVLRGGRLFVNQKQGSRAVRVSSEHLEVSTKGASFSVFSPNEEINGYLVRSLGGEVSATFQRPGQEPKGPVIVEDNKARQFFLERGEREKLETDGRPERAWLEKGKRFVAAETVRLDSPPPSLVPPVAEAAGKAIFFRESENIMLDDTLPVDISAPGEYGAPGGEPDRDYALPVADPLPAGTKVVASYLLHFEIDPGIEAKGFYYREKFVFDDPIIGIIATADNLHASTPVFQHPDCRYTGEDRKRNVACEFSYGDRIVLSKDRKNLFVKLGSMINADQIRILFGEGD